MVQPSVLFSEDVAQDLSGNFYIKILSYDEANEVLKVSWIARKDIDSNAWADLDVDVPAGNVDNTPAVQELIAAAVATDSIPEVTTTQAAFNLDL